MCQCAFIFMFPYIIARRDYLLMLNYWPFKAKRYIYEGFLVWIIRSTYHVLQGWWLGIKQCFTPYFKNIYICIYICSTYWMYIALYYLHNVEVTCLSVSCLYDYTVAFLYVYTFGSSQAWIRHVYMICNNIHHSIVIHGGISSMIHSSWDWVIEHV